MSNYRASGKLQGRVALITGGDSGIGHAVAVAFAKEGADVAIVYHDAHEDAQRVKQEVEQQGRKCLAIAGDVGDETFCQQAVKQAVQELGKQVPMRRPGQPDELAPAYVFLASNDSSYMSGQVLHLNGGVVVNG